MNAATVEIIGYVGSALVLVSFLMASVVKLRVVNAIGSGIFAAYALIIHSYPTMIMNICLVLINLYYLWKLRNRDPNYHMVRVSPTDLYLSAFLNSHQPDIAACFPGRSWDASALDHAYLICHGDETAGVLMGAEKSRSAEHRARLYNADLPGYLRRALSAGPSAVRKSVSAAIRECGAESYGIPEKDGLCREIRRF